MAPPLHRHQLLRLSRHGWTRVLRAAHDDARACLELWAERDHPLVVTRQPETIAEGRIAAGLPAPARFGRRRLSLEIDAAGVASTGRFCVGPVAAISLSATPGTAGAHGRLTLSGRISCATNRSPVRRKAVAPFFCSLV